MANSAKVTIALQYANGTDYSAPLIDPTKVEYEVTDATRYMDKYVYIDATAGVEFGLETWNNGGEGSLGFLAVSNTGSDDAILAGDDVDGTTFAIRIIPGEVVVVSSVDLAVACKLKKVTNETTCRVIAVGNDGN